ncbi:MAG: endonuclease V [Candidatus Nanopelagicales bacterium]
MDPAWPANAHALDAEQLRLAAVRPTPWILPAGGIAVAGCFLAFARGEQGPGHPGDRGWVAAAVVECATGRTLASNCLPCRAGASYEAGRLALREGSSLEAAVAELEVAPDVLMVDATGRDHPRRAGLALHLGAVLGLPSIGVTHRPLIAEGPQPGAQRGATSPLLLDGEVVGAWVRTQVGVRPLAVHAGWQTDAETAIAITLACTALARTPEPLRRARVAARTTRAFAEGRTRQEWRDPLAWAPSAPLRSVPPPPG